MNNWTTNLQGMLVAIVRRGDIHPNRTYCDPRQPCDLCRPLLDTIAYNRARIPRWVLFIGDSVERAYSALDAVRRKPR